MVFGCRRLPQKSRNFLTNWQSNHLSNRLAVSQCQLHYICCNIPPLVRLIQFKLWPLWLAGELSDAPEIGGLNSAPGSDSQHAINYSTLASAAAAAGAVAPGVGVGVSVDPSISSTETLLRNIQGLLKVAADNARQQERQINYEKSEYNWIRQEKFIAFVFCFGTFSIFPTEWIVKSLFSSVNSYQ